MEVDVSIVGEVVGKTIITSMTITENDNLRLIIETNTLCCFVRFGESVLGRHRYPFSKDTIPD